MELVLSMPLALLVFEKKKESNKVTVEVWTALLLPRTSEYKSDDQSRSGYRNRVIIRLTNGTGWMM